jgi:hypothetical protein
VYLFLASSAYLQKAKYDPDFQQERSRVPASPSPLHQDEESAMSGDDDYVQEQRKKKKKKGKRHGDGDELPALKKRKRRELVAEDIDFENMDPEQGTCYLTVALKLLLKEGDVSIV